MQLSTQTLIVLVAVCSASTVKGPCGPQTKVCTALATNAVDVPQYDCKPAVSGAKVVVSKEENKFGAKICGPGKFFFSPMQCAGSNFEYKKKTIEVDDTEVTTECKVVPFPYNMACYTVEC